MNERWDDDVDDGWDDESDDDATNETVLCSACGAEVYEDALRCPICGDYITRSNSIFAGRPWWWIALGIAGVVAVIVTSLILGFGL